MHSIVVVENLSLDGVMQAPGRTDEDTRGGFDRGGWAVEYLLSDPEAARAAMSGPATPTGMLFGHRTYLDLVGRWLSTTEPNPFTDVLRAAPKYVASRADRIELPHPNSTALCGEATLTVAELKRSGEGDLVVLGSGELVRALTAAGLVDRFVLTVLPVVLGQGTRLFGDSPLDLSVSSSTTSATGIVTATYEVRHTAGDRH